MNVNVSIRLLFESAGDRFCTVPHFFLVAQSRNQPFGGGWNSPAITT